MAFIDVDLLKESVLGWNPPLDNEQLKHMIDTIPTADVVEVKHGEWIVNPANKYGGDYMCSICGNDADESSGGSFDILTNYCSDCGAIMEVKDVY